MVLKEKLGYYGGYPVTMEEANTDPNISAPARPDRQEKSQKTVAEIKRRKKLSKDVKAQADPFTPSFDASRTTGTDEGSFDMVHQGSAELRRLKLKKNLYAHRNTCPQGSYPDCLEGGKLPSNDDQEDGLHSMVYRRRGATSS
jgi:hypothetical protein